MPIRGGNKCFGGPWSSSPIRFLFNPMRCSSICGTIKLWKIQKKNSQRISWQNRTCCGYGTGCGTFCTENGIPLILCWLSLICCCTDWFMCCICVWKFGCGWCSIIWFSICDCIIGWNWTDIPVTVGGAMCGLKIPVCKKISKYVRKITRMQLAYVSVVECEYPWFDWLVALELLLGCSPSQFHLAPIWNSPQEHFIWKIVLRKTKTFQNAFEIHYLACGAAVNWKLCTFDWTCWMGTCCWYWVFTRKCWPDDETWIWCCWVGGAVWICCSETGL